MLKEIPSWMLAKYVSLYVWTVVLILVDLLMAVVGSCVDAIESPDIECCIEEGVGLLVDAGLTYRGLLEVWLLSTICALLGGSECVVFVVC